VDSGSPSLSGKCFFNYILNSTSRLVLEHFYVIRSLEMCLFSYGILFKEPDSHLEKDFFIHRYASAARSLYLDPDPPEISANAKRRFSSSVSEQAVLDVIVKI
jgi:hypothetical protein